MVYCIIMIVQLVVCGPQRCVWSTEGARKLGGSFSELNSDATLPVSPHDRVLLCASTRSTASVPVLSSCSDLQLLPVLFTSLDWVLRLQGSRLTPVSGAVPGAVPTAEAGASQRGGMRQCVLFLTGVRMGFLSPLN